MERHQGSWKVEGEEEYNIGELVIDNDYIEFFVRGKSIPWACTFIGSNGEHPIKVFQKNNMYLVIGIVFALIVSVFVVIIISLNRKLKKQEEYYNEEIEKLGIDDLKKEKDELLKSMEYLKERISDVEHERDDIEQEIERLEQELELFKNKCEYYINTVSVNRKILYSLKNNKKYENTELQTLISEIEYIFRDDVFSKTAKMNTRPAMKSQL